MPPELPARLPRVIAAPMAGGPSTPELLNAVSFGFLAWGTCSLDQAREELSRVRDPFGINLFYPQREQPRREDLEAIATELDAQIPEPDYSFGFDDKLNLALEDGRATIISCTFGCFTEAEFKRIHAAGMQAWVTVTNEVDALKATERGADGLIVQGPKAGGHRSTWTITEEPEDKSLEKLLAGIFRHVNVPLIAAGGARTQEDVERLIEWGAQAVACGSAFLLSDEAGTSKANREILRAGGTSVSTRAFSGRYARGVETRFVREHSDLPALYPQLNAMQKPLRSNPDHAYCLVGDDFAGRLMEGPAATIEAKLLGTGRMG